MTEIKYYDEADLQRKIVSVLNRYGYHFEDAPSPFFCDIIDKVRKIYIEVKPEHFAPAQILYGLAKKDIKEISYIGLACSFEIRFYKPPTYDVMMNFAKSIDPNLLKPPSEVKKQKWHDKAFELLGDHWKIYTYKGEFDLNEPTKDIFVDEENYTYFRDLFNKYEIDSSRFLPYIADIHAKNQKIIVNNEGWILNINTGKFFRNTDREQRGLDEYVGRYKYRPVKNYRDKTLFESIRIRADDIQELLHEIDRLEPLHSRRFRGRFFTKENLGIEISDIAESINPGFIIEPYVGAGSLIEPLISRYKGVANDINKGFIDVLRKKFEGLDWKVTNLNTITTSVDELISKWNVPKGEEILILTNPPFGTSSTSILVSKKNEIKDGKKSRKTKIDYGGMGDKYGRGDLVLPAIGKLIEIIKRLNRGYMAVFSPAGVWLGRKRYNKLMKSVLKDFEFFEGHIFSGKGFNSVVSKKAISFTIWRYKKDIQTNREDLIFMYEKTPIHLKMVALLKEGGRYRDGSKYVTNKVDHPLGVRRNDTFNNPNPKIFTVDVKEGSGAEISKDNVKIDLKIAKIPSELIYGLWSVTVGHRSIAGHPIFIDNAHTHLPDFSKKETMEILAYSLIHTLITELKNNYCQGKIGFIGLNRIFQFGNTSLTNGVKHLIEKYGYCNIGEKTILDVFEELKTEPNIDNIDNNYRRKIKEEITRRLDLIAFWDFIPIPNNI